MIRITVWNEYRHEKNKPSVAKIYPNGMHEVIKSFLSEEAEFEVRTATLEEPEHGLTQEILNDTDVLIWWEHLAHDEVDDEIVNRVHARILDGMGFIPLHSSHFSKIFKKLMGTTCNLKWRVQAEKERLWVIEPGHPIVQGISEYIELPNSEMYGEKFDIPTPDQLIFISWSEGGNVFRSGCCYFRGNGKIFYLKPGHEMYPIFYNKEIQQVIKNAVKWAAPIAGARRNFGKAVPALDEIKSTFKA